MREARVLACIYEIAAEGVDPSAHAVALVMRADFAVERFQYLRTYGCLQSFSVKKIKTMVTSLLKKGYLSDYSPPPFLERYLLLTPKGEEEAMALLAKKSIRRLDPSPSVPLFNERK